MQTIYYSFRAPDGMQIFERMSGEHDMATFDNSFWTNEEQVKKVVVAKIGRRDDLTIYANEQILYIPLQSETI